MSNAPIELWPPAFDAAIFDFDGTISDTGWLWHEVDRTFLAARGIEYSVEYARRLSVLGFQAGAIYTIETYGLDESPEDICDEWTRLSHALYRTRVHLRPGVQAYIDALHSRGVRTALATANEPELISTMENVPIDALFDARVHGRDVGATKDKPDIYFEAARLLGADPARCIVFEDIPPAAKTAHDAGFLTCGVNSGDKTQDIDELRRVTDLYLHDWEDIKL